MDPDAWEKALAAHPDRALVRLAVDGIRNGVHLLYTGPRESRDCRNRPSAEEFAEAIDSDLSKEVAAGRMLQFSTKPALLFCSPIGTVAKAGTTARRRIADMSAPKGRSVNDGVADQPLQYASFDHAVAIVRRCGPQCRIAKVDVKSAFRCVAVHPDDRWLLGMRWRHSWFVDLMLPFGLKSSPGLWDRYASLLEWILRQRGLRNSFYFVDDTIIGGAADSDQCERDVQLLLATMNELGVPVNADKLKAEGTPSTVAKVLGIEIDTNTMTARLSADKLAAISTAIDDWLSDTRDRTISELQSLIGTLVFAAKVVPAGRTFIRRLLALLHLPRRRRSKHHRVRIDDDARDDLRWWKRFIGEWNGVTMLPTEPFFNPPPVQCDPTAPKAQLYTDACRTGYGCVFGRKWFAGRWTEPELAAAMRRSDVSMPYLELLAILLAVTTFAPELTGRRVVLWSDCQPAVDAVNSGTCAAPELMRLVRHVLYTAATARFAIQLRHIAGVANTAADLLSRGEQVKCMELNPLLDRSPTPIGLAPTRTW